MFSLDLSQAPAIDFAPANELAGIMQNIRCLFKTVAGSCPYYRDFGLSDDLLDNPLPVARAKFANEFVKKINRYEPRIRVYSIEWPEVNNDAESGKLSPIIKFKES